MEDKKMKKFTAMMLVLAMIAVLLTGCGGDSGNKGEKEKSWHYTSQGGQTLCEVGVCPPVRLNERFNEKR